MKRASALTTSEALQAIKAISPEQKRALDRLLLSDGRIWVPQDGPQCAAYASKADILFYGGSAGGGKTDLLLGLMHGMAAGALGLPMVSTLLAVASMLGGDDDEPFDAQTALQNMLTDTFGQKPAEVMAHGLSRLTP